MDKQFGQHKRTGWSSVAFVEDTELDEATIDDM